MKLYIRKLFNGNEIAREIGIALCKHDTFLVQSKDIVTTLGYLTPFTRIQAAAEDFGATEVEWGQPIFR